MAGILTPRIRCVNSNASRGTAFKACIGSLRRCKNDAAENASPTFMKGWDTIIHGSRPSAVLEKSRKTPASRFSSSSCLMFSVRLDYAPDWCLSNHLPACIGAPCDEASLKLRLPTTSNMFDMTLTRGLLSCRKAGLASTLGFQTGLLATAAPTES